MSLDKMTILPALRTVRLPRASLASGRSGVPSQRRQVAFQSPRLRATAQAPQSVRAALRASRRAAPALVDDTEPAELLAMARRADRRSLAQSMACFVLICLAAVLWVWH
jgi:hypothetical protein